MTEKLTVRPFEPKDTEDIHRICRETCSDSFLLANETVLYTKYADYYMQEEPEHLFVLADGADRAQGYVLCAADPEKYISLWKKKYLPRLRGFGHGCILLQYYTLFEVKRMAGKGYPAHLHIDISPEYQHAGGGTQLIHALRDRLRDDGVPGLYLGCSASNAVGTAFYTKYGFSVDHRFPGGRIFVIGTER